MMLNCLFETRSLRADSSKGGVHFRLTWGVDLFDEMAIMTETQ